MKLKHKKWTGFGLLFLPFILVLSIIYYLQVNIICCIRVSTTEKKKFKKMMVDFRFVFLFLYPCSFPAFTGGHVMKRRPHLRNKAALITRFKNELTPTAVICLWLPFLLPLNRLDSSRTWRRGTCNCFWTNSTNIPARRVNWGPAPIQAA